MHTFVSDLTTQMLAPCSPCSPTHVGIWEEYLVLADYKPAEENGNGEHVHQLPVKAMETVTVLTKGATGKYTE